MGTHPIFESDFDCLTVYKMKRRKSNAEIKSVATRAHCGVTFSCYFTVDDWTVVTE